jgi:hypothetical protein
LGAPSSYGERAMAKSGRVRLSDMRRAFRLIHGGW